MVDSWRESESGTKIQPAQQAIPPQRNALASPTTHQAQQVKPARQTPQTQQQMLQLQQQQLRMARAKFANYTLATTSQEILKKYSKYPPSLTFHIYDTHYRFNNTQDSSIIPKDSPMVKSFLKHVINEEIPVEMTELLKDFALRFYEGCLILQVYDHRNMISTDQAERPPENSSTSANGDPVRSESASKPAASSPAKVDHPQARPKTYRTLLKPTAQTLYYDLLYHTDSTLTKFTDLLSLQIESEILTLTNRKVDLSVPLNPYLQDDYLRPEVSTPEKVWDEELGDYKMVHSHREATAVEIRKLHQDQLTMQKSSEFEEMMFLLSNKYKNPSESTSEKKLVVVGPSIISAADSVNLEGMPSAGSSGRSTAATDKTKPTPSTGPMASGSSVLSSGNTTSNQFMRLRFIEEIRKRKESQKAQAGAAVAAQAGSGSLTGGALNGSANGITNRPAQASPQVQAPFVNPRFPQGQNAIANTAGKGTRLPQQVQQQRQFQQNPQFRAQQQQQPHLQQSQQQVQHQSPPLPQRQFSPQQGLQSPVQQQVPANLQNSQAAPRQLGQQQGHPNMNQRMSPEFGAAGATNPRSTQGIPRQNIPNAQGIVQGHNQQTMPQQPQQSQQQSQQLAKQANRIRAQQYQMQQARQQQLRQQQALSQQSSPQHPQQVSVQAAQMAQAQAAKRQKIGDGMGQIPQQNQYNQSMRTPQMGSMPQPGSNVGSNVGTPIMGNAALNNTRMGNSGSVSSPQMSQQMPQISQQMQGSMPYQQSPQNQMANRPATQPAATSGQQVTEQKPTIQQQQQQQIFQMTLSPQEQHTFRQLQTRMNALVQMGNTGVAPNRNRLTPQQQQQAIQQAKLIQQQLLQRFPAYFQRLRQFQVLQQSRRQAMQRQQAQGSQPQSQSVNNMGASDGSMFSPQNVNAMSPAMQQQMIGSPMMSQMGNGMRPGQGKQ